MSLAMTLTDHLKELHMPTIRALFEDTARRAEQESLSYEQYLLYSAQED
jgi:hypothetical protein